MKVTLKQDRSCACFRGPHAVKAGQTVDTAPAENQPDWEKLGLRWVVEPDRPAECYGILLDRNDYA